MKLLKRYFGPYAEYPLQLSLAKDVLQAALLQECAAVLPENKTDLFTRSLRDPLVLYPVRMSRNSLRGRCLLQPEDNAALRITLAPPPWIGIFAGIWCGFALLTGITAALSGYWWQIPAALAMIGFLFLILEICRAFATDEIPQICRDLNTFLRKLEQKYSGEKQ